MAVLASDLRHALRRILAATAFLLAGVLIAATYDALHRDWLAALLDLACAMGIFAAGHGTWKRLRRYSV